MFEDDPHDPIPNVNVIDINKVKHGGGSDLYIVVAKPIAGSESALERLLKKVETYLVFIHSEQFTAESGQPSTESTRIVVKLHPDSHPKARELLERNAAWIRNNGATLVIDTDLLRA